MTFLLLAEALFAVTYGCLLPAAAVATAVTTTGI